MKEKVSLGLKQKRIHNSERATLTEVFSKRFPVNTALEVGSAFGYSFYFISKIFPEAKLVGIDPDPLKIRYGQLIKFSEKIANLELCRGEGTDLRQFANRSFEIVFSSAALIYVPPAKIKITLQEMIRVCSRSLLLLELHQANPYFEAQSQGCYVMRQNKIGGYWVRDYVSLIKSILPKAEVKLTKVTNALWQDEPWKELGYVIEVDLA